MPRRGRAPSRGRGSPAFRNEHVRYDGGRKINRDGVRIWVETYTCRLCGIRLDVKEEILNWKAACASGALFSIAAFVAGAIEPGFGEGGLLS